MGDELDEVAAEYGANLDDLDDLEELDLGCGEGEEDGVIPDVQVDDVSDGANEVVGVDCEDCGELPAFIYCDDCELKYCTECSEQIHDVGAPHAIFPLGPDGEILDEEGEDEEEEEEEDDNPCCDDCEERPATCECEECELFFCTECYELIHKRGVFTRHTKKELDIPEPAPPKKKKLRRPKKNSSEESDDYRMSMMLTPDQVNELSIPKSPRPEEEDVPDEERFFFKLEQPIVGSQARVTDASERDTVGKILVEIRANLDATHNAELFGLRFGNAWLDENEEVTLEDAGVKRGDVLSYEPNIAGAPAVTTFKVFDAARTLVAAKKPNKNQIDSEIFGILIFHIRSEISNGRFIPDRDTAVYLAGVMANLQKRSTMDVDPMEYLAPHWRESKKIEEALQKTMKKSSKLHAAALEVEYVVKAVAHPCFGGVYVNCQEKVKGKKTVERWAGLDREKKQFTVMDAGLSKVVWSAPQSQLRVQQEMDSVVVTTDKVFPALGAGLSARFGQALPDKVEKAATSRFLFEGQAAQAIEFHSLITKQKEEEEAAKKKAAAATSAGGRSVESYEKEKEGLERMLALYKPGSSEYAGVEKMISDIQRKIDDLIGVSNDVLEENEEAVIENVHEEDSVGVIENDGGEAPEEPNADEPNEIPECDDCCEAPAIMMCSTCELNYCQDCSDQMHDIGEPHDITFFDGVADDVESVEEKTEEKTEEKNPLPKPLEKPNAKATPRPRVKKSSGGPDRVRVRESLRNSGHNSTEWVADNDDNILFERKTKNDIDPQIRAATLTKLVEYLTHERYAGADLQSVFFYTYTNFTTSEELLVLLANRFSISPPSEKHDDEHFISRWRKAVQTPIRLKVASALKYWITNHVEELLEEDVDGEECDANQPTMLDLIGEFVDGPLMEGMPPAARSLRKLLSKTETAGGRPSEPDLSLLPPPPPPKVPQGAVTLFSVDPEEVARQLSLVEFTMWYRIRTSEFKGLAWSKPGKELHSPNILELIKRFNNVSTWVTYMIVAETSKQQRSTLIGRFIAIADKCMELNNFNGVMEICAGLSSNPVYRLKHTWEGVPERSKRTYADLQVLIARGRDNYGPMRSAIERALPGPVLPYLGMYLTDLTFIEDGNPNYISNITFFYVIYKCKGGDGNTPVEFRLKGSAKLGEVFARVLADAPEGANTTDCALVVPSMAEGQMERYLSEYNDTLNDCDIKPGCTLWLQNRFRNIVVVQDDGSEHTVNYDALEPAYTMLDDLVLEAEMPGEPENYKLVVEGESEPLALEKTLWEQGVLESDRLIVQHLFSAAFTLQESTEPKVVNLVYEECRAGILNAQQEVDNATAIGLAALQIHAMEPPANGGESDLSAMDDDMLVALMPPRWQPSPEKFKKEMSALRKALAKKYKEVDKTVHFTKAKLTYIRKCSMQPTYGSTLIEAKIGIKGGKKKAVPCFVGITFQRTNVVVLDEKVQEVSRLDLQTTYPTLEGDMVHLTMPPAMASVATRTKTKEGEVTLFFESASKASSFTQQMTEKPENKKKKVKKSAPEFRPGDFPPAENAPEEEAELPARLLHFKKQRLLVEVFKTVEQCQRVPFNFAAVDAIQAMINNPVVLEGFLGEDELYEMSLACEARE